jgi:hypothetical protein
MKNIIMLILCIFIVSCENIDLDNIGLSNEKANDSITDLKEDLKYIVNGELVGQGYNSSSVSRNFISCAPSVAFTNNAFSNILKSFMVAYGVSFSAITCGSCTGFRFSCVPGANVTLSSSYFHPLNAPAGSFTEPADYDSHNPSAASAGPFNYICPSEGYVEQTAAGGSTTYMKLTATSNGNSDTEYLECQ